MTAPVGRERLPDKVELRRLALDAMAARHLGYQVAIDALHEMQRGIKPEHLLALLNEIDEQGVELNRLGYLLAEAHERADDLARKAEP